MPNLFTFATDDPAVATRIIAAMGGGPVGDQPVGRKHAVKDDKPAKGAELVQHTSDSAPVPANTPSVVAGSAPAPAAPAPAPAAPAAPAPAAPPPAAPAPAPAQLPAAEGWTLEHVLGMAKDFISNPAGGPEKLGKILDGHGIPAVKQTPPHLFHVVYGEMEAALKGA